MISSERLILRPVMMCDRFDIFDYSKNENIGRNAGWAPHSSIDETESILDDIFIGKDGIFSIILKERPKVIGTIGLTDDPARSNPSSRMLGYSLSEEYWGKGYMTEAVNSVLKYGFENMGLSIITANCYAENSRSCSVLKKCGFIYEGTLRSCALSCDGVLHGCEFYSITIDEYKKAV